MEWLRWSRGPFVGALACVSLIPAGCGPEEESDPVVDLAELDESVAASVAPEPTAVSVAAPPAAGVTAPDTMVASDAWDCPCSEPFSSSSDRDNWRQAIWTYRSAKKCTAQGGFVSFIPNMSNPAAEIIGVNCLLPSMQQWFESRPTSNACLTLTMLERISICSYPADWTPGLLSATGRGW
jgi:hypothetical protein